MIIDHYNLKLEFREKLDGVMAKRGVGVIPALIRDLHLGHGHTFYPHLNQGRAHILHLEGSDDRLDFLHSLGQFAGRFRQMQVSRPRKLLTAGGDQTGFCPESDKEKRVGGSLHFRLHYHRDSAVYLLRAMKGRDRQPVRRQQGVGADQRQVQWRGSNTWQEIIPLGVVLTCVTALIFAALSLVHTNTNSSTPGTEAQEPEVASAGPETSPLMAGTENPVPAAPSPAPVPTVTAKAESPDEHLQPAQPPQLGLGTVAQHSNPSPGNASASVDAASAGTPESRSGFQHEEAVRSAVTKPMPQPSAVAKETGQHEAPSPPEAFRERAEQVRAVAERKRDRLEKLYQRHLISGDAYAKGQAEYQNEIAQYENQIANYENQVVKYRSQ
jgi:hypothetical protein